MIPVQLYQHTPNQLLTPLMRTDSRNLVEILQTVAYHRTKVSEGSQQIFQMYKNLDNTNRTAIKMEWVVHSAAMTIESTQVI